MRKNNLKRILVISIIGLSGVAGVFIADNIWVGLGVSVMVAGASASWKLY